MRRLALMGFVLVSAACNGGSDSSEPTETFLESTTTSPVEADSTTTSQVEVEATEGFVVLGASSDGVVKVEAAEGSSAIGVEVTVDKVENGRATQDRLFDGLGGEIVEYELGPDGQEFDEPVLVSFISSMTKLGLESNEVPLPLISVSHAGGAFEPLAATVQRIGAQITMSVQLDHFSDIALYPGSYVALESGLGGPVSLQIGETLTVSGAVRESISESVDPDRSFELRLQDSGVVVASQQGKLNDNMTVLFACQVLGSPEIKVSLYDAEWNIDSVLTTYFVTCQPSLVIDTAEPVRNEIVIELPGSPVGVVGGYDDSVWVGYVAGEGDLHLAVIDPVTGNIERDDRIPPAVFTRTDRGVVAQAIFEQRTYVLDESGEIVADFARSVDLVDPTTGLAWILGPEGVSVVDPFQPIGNVDDYPNYSFGNATALNGNLYGVTEGNNPKLVILGQDPTLEIPLGPLGPQSAIDPTAPVVADGLVTFLDRVDQTLYIVDLEDQSVQTAPIPCSSGISCRVGEGGAHGGGGTALGPSGVIHTVIGGAAFYESFFEKAIIMTDLATGVATRFEIDAEGDPRLIRGFESSGSEPPLLWVALEDQKTLEDEEIGENGAALAVTFAAFDADGETVGEIEGILGEMGSIQFPVLVDGSYWVSYDSDDDGGVDSMAEYDSDFQLVDIYEGTYSSVKASGDHVWALGPDGSSTVETVRLLRGG